MKVAEWSWMHNFADERNNENGDETVKPKNPILYESTNMEVYAMETKKTYSENRKESDLYNLMNEQ